MSEILPNPGEVWICINNKLSKALRYENDIMHQGDSIPFIVTYLSLGRVGYVQAHRSGCGAYEYYIGYNPSKWKWEDHFLRVWPVDERHVIT